MRTFLDIFTTKMYDVGWSLVFENLQQDISYSDGLKAFTCFRIAAGLGDEWSMLELGAMYLLGRGVGKSRKKSIYWYKRAEKKNAIMAYRCLGNFYRYVNKQDGTPVPTTNRKHIVQAYKYFAQGARLGEANCLYELGDYYRDGICVKKDLRKAFLLYRKAYKQILEYDAEALEICNDSYMDTCLRLAECYHYGWGTDINFDKAKEFILIAKKDCERRTLEGDVYGRAYSKRILDEEDKINNMQTM